MENNKTPIRCLLSLAIVMASAVLQVFSQNSPEYCVTIPYFSNELIQVNKETGEEIVLGTIGTKKVQALALVPTADTIYAAKANQLGIITFDSYNFIPLPSEFGSGNGDQGPLDFIEVEGLSFDKGGKTLFASVKVAEPNNDILIKLNTTTGQFIPDAFGPGQDYVTIAGNGVFSIVEDIAINPVDGQMYGLAREEVGNDILISINKQDGSATQIGVTGINLLEGLGFDNKGNLFATPGLNTTLPSRFFQMDLTTGLAMSIGELTSSVDYESCDCLYPNTAPDAQDDSYTADVGDTLQINAPGVLANDTDLDDDPLTIIAYDTTTVAGGSVTLNPDGGFVYIPVDEYIGEDFFDYVVSDGNGGTDTATVNIGVYPDGYVEPDSLLARDDNYITEVNMELTVKTPGVLANDSAPNDEELTITDYDQTGSLGGTVMLNPDGSFTFTPATDSMGVDTFTYIVSDPFGNTDTAMVSIEIKNPGGDSQNSPPIAENDSLEIDLDNELIITDPIEGVLQNDSDPDGDSIAVQETIDELTDQGGRINLHSDGTLSYMPRLGFVGTDSIEYIVCDDRNPQLCDTAKIYIEVKELPIEVFDAFSPNGDGINDTWVIQGITRFPDNEVQIFNRWGNLIFQASGYDNTTKTWRGNASKGVVLGGDEVPDGAYFYVIDLGDGSKRLSGYVVVRR